MKNNMDFDFELSDEDFSDFEIDTDITFETRIIKPPKSKKLKESRLKYSKAEDLAKQTIIDKDQRYFVVLNGNFYFGDYIEALIVLNNARIKKMTISTLSLNENNVDSLANLLNGGFVDELNLIVSDYFFSHERHNLIPYLYKQLDKDDKFQLAAARTHCKLCIFETYGGKFVVIHGSANLRSSDNLEQIVIEESEELYKFNEEYQDRIIEKYLTINKKIGGNELWQVVATEEKKEAKPVQVKKARQQKEHLYLRE